MQKIDNKQLLLSDIIKNCIVRKLYKHLVICSFAIIILPVANKVVIFCQSFWQLSTFLNDIRKNITKKC